MTHRGPTRRGALAGLTALLACPAYLRAQGTEEIEVSQYGNSPGGMVYAVALGKGVDPRYDDGLANAIVNLGNVRAMAGRREDALALWQQALVIRERRDGKDSREVASILENLATVLGELGRTDEAEAVRARLAAIRSLRR